MPILPGRMRAAAWLVAGCILLPTSGCAVGMQNSYPVSAPARAAVNPPERFLVGTLNSGEAPSAPQPNTGCRNPMVDPRDGTRLTLVQSQAGERGGIGDYSVPPGRYGVGRGELLRLECGTGKVLGIVPARS